MDQHASASDGSTVFQAGRDLTVHLPRPATGAWKVPPRTPNFTGRTEDLDRLATLLDQATVTVRAVRGMGGVGKTQLAIEHCHRHAKRYDALGGVLDLDTFSRAESVALLNRRTGIPEEHADELADVLGDLPLGLEQAGGLPDSDPHAGGGVPGPPPPRPGEDGGQGTGRPSPLTGVDARDAVGIGS